MNSTKWPSLTEFAKFVGREGTCRVEEDEKGVHIPWIDNSPEALRRQDEIRKKERQDRRDEEREEAAIREQVRRAQADAEARGEGDLEEEERQLKRAEGETIKLSFGAKPATKAEPSNAPAAVEAMKDSAALPRPDDSPKDSEQKEESLEKDGAKSKEAPVAEAAPAELSLKMGFSSKPKNVFAAAKKNALGGKKAAVIEHPKKMSEAERIMRKKWKERKERTIRFWRAGTKEAEVLNMSSRFDPWRLIREVDIASARWMWLALF